MEKAFVAPLEYLIRLPALAYSLMKATPDDHLDTPFLVKAVQQSLKSIREIGDNRLKKKHTHVAAILKQCIKNANRLKDVQDHKDSLFGTDNLLKPFKIGNLARDTFVKVNDETLSGSPFLILSEKYLILASVDLEAETQSAAWKLVQFAPISMLIVEEQEAAMAPTTTTTTSTTTTITTTTELKIRSSLADWKLATFGFETESDAQAWLADLKLLQQRETQVSVNWSPLTYYLADSKESQIYETAHRLWTLGTPAAMEDLTFFKDLLALAQVQFDDSALVAGAVSPIRAALDPVRSVRALPKNMSGIALVGLSPSASAVAAEDSSPIHAENTREVTDVDEMVQAKEETPIENKMDDSVGVFAVEEAPVEIVATAVPHEKPEEASTVSDAEPQAATEESANSPTGNVEPGTATVWEPETPKQPTPEESKLTVIRPQSAISDNSDDEPVSPSKPSTPASQPRNGQRYDSPDDTDAPWIYDTPRTKKKRGFFARLFGKKKEIEDQTKSDHSIDRQSLTGESAVFFSPNRASPMHKRRVETSKASTAASPVIAPKLQTTTTTTTTEDKPREAKAEATELPIMVPLPLLNMQDLVQELKQKIDATPTEDGPSQQEILRKVMESSNIQTSTQSSAVPSSTQSPVADKRMGSMFDEMKRKQEENKMTTPFLSSNGTKETTVDEMQTPPTHAASPSPQVTSPLPHVSSPVTPFKTATSSEAAKLTLSSNALSQEKGLMRSPSLTKVKLVELVDGVSASKQSLFKSQSISKLASAHGSNKEITPLPSRPLVAEGEDAQTSEPFALLPIYIQDFDNFRRIKVVPSLTMEDLLLQTLNKNGVEEKPDPEAWNIFEADFNAPLDSNSPLDFIRMDRATMVMDTYQLWKKTNLSEKVLILRRDNKGTPLLGKKVVSPGNRTSAEGKNAASLVMEQRLLRLKKSQSAVDGGSSPGKSPSSPEFREQVLASAEQATSPVSKPEEVSVAPENAAVTSTGEDAIPPVLASVAQEIVESVIASVEDAVKQENSHDIVAPVAEGIVDTAVAGVTHSEEVAHPVVTPVAQEIVDAAVATVMPPEEVAHPVVAPVAQEIVDAAVAQAEHPAADIKAPIAEVVSPLDSQPSETETSPSNATRSDEDPLSDGEHSNHDPTVVAPASPSVTAKSPTRSKSKRGKKKGRKHH